MYNTTHNNSIFGTNPLCVVTTTWQQAGYTTYFMWANFTIFNAGPAAASLLGSVIFVTGALLDRNASIWQCFAFGNSTCVLSVRLVWTPHYSNQSYVAFGMEVDVVLEPSWSLLGKSYSQNVTIDTVPNFPICDNIHPYLFLLSFYSWFIFHLLRSIVFPEIVLLNDPTKLSRTQNPLGLSSSAWLTNNSSSLPAMMHLSSGNT